MGTRGKSSLRLRVQPIDGCCVKLVFLSLLHLIHEPDVVSIRPLLYLLLASNSSSVCVSTTLYVYGVS